MNIFNSLSKNQFKLSNTKLEVVRSAPPTGIRDKTYGEDAETKQGNFLIGYSLSGGLFWESLVGCL